MLETLAAKIGLSLLFRKVKKINVPSWVWVLAAGILLAVGGYFYHAHKVSAFETTIRADQKGKDDQAHATELAQAHQDALSWKAKYIGASTSISTQGKIDHAVSVDRNAALAGSLRSKGSGKADIGLVCGASTFSCSSGYQQGTGTAVHAEVGPVSYRAGSNFIVVPRDDLITFAQHYDDNRDEVKTWRNDKVQQENLYNSLLNDHLSGK
jgi:hypothetical protein